VKVTKIALSLNIVNTLHNIPKLESADLVQFYDSNEHGKRIQRKITSKVPFKHSSYAIPPAERTLKKKLEGEMMQADE